MNKLTISSILATIVLIIDIYFGQHTYSFSNCITKYLQEQFEYGQEKGGFEFFFLIFSTAGDAIVTNILTILIWFKTTNKVQILKIVTMNVVASSIGNLIKMISAQPRPFYIDDQIRLDFCYTGYGDPSGHSLRPFVFFVLLFETILCQKYFYENNVFLNQETQFQGHLPSSVIQQSISCRQRFQLLYPNSPISFRQCQILMGIFVFMIGIGRLYFGVHFLNQIIVGWILGLYLLYIYYFCGLEDFIDCLFIEAKTIKSQAICKKITKYIKMGLIISFLYSIALVIYYFRHYSEQIIGEKEEWRKFILKQIKCLYNGNYSYETKFEASDVQHITIIFFPLYLFILYEQQTEQTKFSPLRVWCSYSNIGKLAINLFCFLIKWKQIEIFQYFQHLLPRLMITLFFMHIYYLTYALILLVLIPLITAVGETIIQSYQKQNETIQVDQSEIEL
ncbi:unnamed protein product [Paramecium pentaurelia]|uniref:Phosphatidic acid phosphatase type 2/haloperoxidase domain-containing protein n=1 Tax=Paramecium pentaurelia TaxID=43138 RepID=A0A8S1WI42_9CILI|nr:unnamed protein product [Paramecium pentaurelia]